MVNKPPYRAFSKAVVTTTKKPSPAQEELARSIADHMDVAYYRYRSSIQRLRENQDADYAVVVGREKIRIQWDGGDFYHHPGISVYRVGVSKITPFIAALRPVWGGRTLDTTMGMGRDALVMADRTENKVLGFEKHPAIAVLTHLGLQSLTRMKRFRKVVPRISVVRGDSFRVMAGLLQPRFDYVLLDPMFPKPVSGSRDMEVMHRLTTPFPFDNELLRLAARSAKRRVLMRWPAHVPVPSVGFDIAIPGARKTTVYLVLNLNRPGTRRRLGCPRSIV
ncbi:MAG: hypothetical protein CMH54_01565 [Myxococcales bacterium]|nr:hypothetical protein [Myxococcales bacterium]